MHYALWRRRLEEEEFRYARGPRSHLCAGEPPERLVVIDSAARLYGCVTCGRSHRCEPSKNSRACMRRLVNNGCSTVCAFSGRVLEDVVMVPGSFKKDQQAMEALRTGPVFDSRPMGAGAVGLQRDMTPSRIRALHHQSNTLPNGTTRRQLVQRADSMKKMRSGAFEAVAFMRTHKERPSALGAEQRQQQAAAEHDASTSMPALMGMDHHDDESSHDGDGGGGSGLSYWTHEAQFQGAYDAQAMETTEPQTLVDDLYQDSYLAPAIDTLREWAEVFEPPPPHVPSSSSSSSMGRPAAAPTPAAAVNNAKWPWPPLTVAMIQQRALPRPPQPLCPHHHALLQRTAHYLRADEEDKGVWACALMADRLLVLHAWMQGHTSSTAAMGQGTRTRQLVDMVLVDILGNDFYMRDADGIQLLVWQAHPRLARKASLNNGHVHMATAFTKILTHVPCSVSVFRQFLHHT